MDLSEWASAYIDNMNFFKQDLISKDIKEKEIICEYKNKGQLRYILEPQLGKDTIEKIKNGNVALICLNSKENLLFMINNWDQFIKNSRLKVIFSNPNLNLQWSIIPYTHDMVSESSCLKLGLKSIFESVPSV